ncbi:MAG: recombinase family protein [Syntrophomonadaceae bacterium]|nr:recombinase family protein [Syntrophomonadaceae bacterium]
MEQKKRVFCLYRVSTIGQVEKGDIPMQKQSCREFAERMGWEIVKEYSEKGVSGFKIATKDRDAIQELQREATLGNFDILLVFMFDRIGRRDDETPFVVEWFVRNGVSVWSVNEGEQRFDSHVDKLMNYLRYWQASGESIKTSIRTKTRLAQIIQEGRFRGGFVPFGYRLEKCGRINKKNKEVYELKVNDQEAAVVRTMFDKYINEGLGALRLCGYLNGRGLKTRKGNDFTNTSIQTILKNIIYTGILRSGETKTEIFPELQIVSVEVFERAQEIMKQRSRNYGCDTRAQSVPVSTKGKSLLTVNIFCGQCGSRLTLNDSRKTYRKSDGSVTVTPRLRYVCYNKVRHPNKCDGQATHLAKKIDDLVQHTLLLVFDRIKELPRTDIIQSRLDEMLIQTKTIIIMLTSSVAKLERDLADYKNEVLKIIRGESAFTAPLLNELMIKTEAQIKESKEEIARQEEH